MSATKFFIAISIALLVAACQPAPEERFSRAQAYFEQSDYRAAVLELKNAIRERPDYAVARSLLAKASYQLGDLQTAETEYERALGLGEYRSEIWVGYGRTLLQQQKAQQAFERVVPNLDPKDGSSLVLQGDILTSLGNMSDAEVAYLAALKLDPGSPGGLIGRAVVAAGGNDHLAAGRFLNDAINANPESPMAWRAKGNYLRTQRDFKGAAEAFAKSMALETKTTPLAERFSTRVSHVSVLIDAGNYEAATAQLGGLSAGFPPHPLLHFLRGHIAFGTGDYDLAQTELQQYLAQVPQDARGQAILGAVNFSQNNLRQAEMYLMQAVRASVGGESTRRLLAETQLRLNKPEEALAALQAAQALGQTDPLLLAMLGRAEIRLGDTESAISYFEQSAAADSGNPAINLALAATYLQANRTEDAIKVLESMHDVPGSQYRRETLLIGAYLRADRREEAIRQGDGLLKKNPNDAAAYSLVGVLHNTIGNKDRALSLFEAALNRDPDNLGALYNLAVMAIAANDMIVAADRLAVLLDAHPAYVPGLVSLATVLLQEGNLDQIRPRLTAAIDLAPESIAPRVLLARVELADGHHDAALNVVNEARRLFREDPGLDHLAGLILRGKGQIGESLSGFARAAAAAPDNPNYVYDLAWTRLKNGDFRGCASAARDYRKLRPTDVRGLSLLVDAEIRAGTPERARADVEVFVAVNSSLASAHLLAGDIELAANSPQAALSHYETAGRIEWTRGAAIQLARAHQAAGTGKATESLSRWLSDHSQDSGARLMYAMILEADGLTDRAVAEYERLHAAGELNAIGLNNLAWQYAVRGRDEAIELAEEAHRLQPDNGSITDTLGWILHNSGDIDRSLPLLRMAAKQSPDNPEVQYHLASTLAKSGETDAAGVIVNELLDSGQSFPSRPAAEHLAKSL